MGEINKQSRIGIARKQILMLAWQRSHRGHQSKKGPGSMLMLAYFDLHHVKRVYEQASNRSDILKLVKEKG